MGADPLDICGWESEDGQNLTPSRRGPTTGKRALLTLAVALRTGRSRPIGDIGAANNGGGNATHSGRSENRHFHH